LKFVAKLLIPVDNFTNILLAAFAPIFFCQKKIQSQSVSREKLCKTLSYKKEAACKLLGKLTPSLPLFYLSIIHLVKLISEINFTNILIKVFTRADPKSAKNTVKLSVFFALLGSEHILAECKMLVKSIPGLPKVHKGFGRGHVLLLHQVSGNDGRGARVAQEAVDEDHTVGKAQGTVDEFNRFFEKLKKQMTNHL